MKIPSEIVDTTFGKLSLIHDSAFFSEVPWSRELDIELVIHFNDENPILAVKNARNIFASVRENEIDLFNQGLKHLTSTGVISDPQEFKDSFLYSSEETSIEIFPNGDGQLVYLLMLVGSLIIEFSHDAKFQNARAIAG